MLCYVMLCYVMLCYVMLCYVAGSVHSTVGNSTSQISDGSDDEERTVGLINLSMHQNTADRSEDWCNPDGFISGCEGCEGCKGCKGCEELTVSLSLVMAAPIEDKRPAPPSPFSGGVGVGVGVRGGVGGGEMGCYEKGIKEMMGTRGSKESTIQTESVPALQRSVSQSMVSQSVVSQFSSSLRYKLTD